MRVILWPGRAISKGASLAGGRRAAFDRESKLGSVCRVGMLGRVGDRPDLDVIVKAALLRKDSVAVKDSLAGGFDATE